MKIAETSDHHIPKYPQLTSSIEAGKTTSQQQKRKTMKAEVNNKTTYTSPK